MAVPRLPETAISSLFYFCIIQGPDVKRKPSSVSGMRMRWITADMAAIWTVIRKRTLTNPLNVNHPALDNFFSAVHNTIVTLLSPKGSIPEYNLKNIPDVF